MNTQEKQLLEAERLVVELCKDEGITQELYAVGVLLHCLEQGAFPEGIALRLAENLAIVASASYTREQLGRIPDIADRIAEITEAALQYAGDES